MVREGEVKFVPERFAKTYTNWMENVHDWCISASCGGATRSRLTCDDRGHINVSWEDPTKCESGSTHLTRDPDAGHLVLQRPRPLHPGLAGKDR
ncbi:MAG: class I tRNA ligase family protein [Dysosmobacter welbionis]